MKSIKVLLATSVAMFAMSAVSAQTLQEVQTQFNVAAEKVNAKQYVEAIPELQKTIEMGLEVPEAMEIVQNAQKYIPVCNRSAGAAAAQSGNLDDAITYFTAAIDTGDLYGDNATVNRAKGMLSKVYSMKGAGAFNDKDYAKAVESFAKGYEVNPQDTGLALNLAMSYCEMGDYQNGMAVYQKVIALGDTHSKFADAAAEAKGKVGYYAALEASGLVQVEKIDEAYAILEQGLTIAPANVDLNTLRVQTATTAKSWDKVIEFGDAALAAWDAAQSTAAEGVEVVSDESRANICYFVAAAYDRKDNNAKAIEYYGKVGTGNNAAAAKARIEELKALNK